MKLIKYQLMSEINRGTEEEPDLEQTFSICEITCPDDKLEANLALAQAEAYNGEVVVEDAGPDLAQPPTQQEQMRADIDFLAAMQGVSL